MNSCAVHDKNPQVLHLEAHLFLCAFLTNNNRRMMVGVREKVRNFASFSAAQKWVAWRAGELTNFYSPE